MPRLRFSHDAHSDLRDIAHFIARDKPVAARQWVGKIKAKCHLVAQHPELGEAREDLGRDVRCTLVGSYVIFYRHRGAVLEVARIIRGDRDIRSI